MPEEPDTLVARDETPWGRSTPATQDMGPRVRAEGAPETEGRYREVGFLGRGGMGEVLLVEDQRIGRLVAKKVIPHDVGAGAIARARFVREARIQGQLEHSSVVPVYDFGWDERGGEYFTMKRVTGLTLRQVIKGLASNDAEMLAKFTRHRLLGVFQQLCLAIDYAHERGVVHRDLKPTNVMIGDYGEVYLLDWGIAKVGAQTEAKTPSVIPPANDDTTRADDVLGTPGYMAPEQIRSSSDVDGRADIYSLGAMLYLILARRPLIAPDCANAAELTLEGLIDPRPSVRSLDPDVPPPELDAVCAKALALDPKDRYPTARALHDAIDAFLAGRRDLELRGALADKYTALAMDTLSTSSANDERARGEAMRQVAHALAMDPTHRGAATVMTRLLLEPPKEPPPEALATLDRDNRAVVVRNGRIAAVLLMCFMIGIPMLEDAGMTSLVGYVGMYGPLGIAALVTGTFDYFPKRFFGAQIAIASVCLAVTFAMSSGLYGAFLLTPVFAQAMISVGCSVPALGRSRALLVVLGIVSFAIPMALEWFGLIPRFYSFEAGRMIVHPGYVALQEAPVRTGLTFATTGAILIAATISWRASSDLASQQKDLHVFAWHLRQLLPDSVRASSSGEERIDDSKRAS